MPNATDLAAMLDRLQPGQLDNLPRSALEKLSDACYRAHALCEQSAGQQAFTRVQRRQAEAPKAGVLVCLRDGERSE
jgi:hypothetical protein